MSDSESDNDFKPLIDNSSNEEDEPKKKPRKTKAKKKADNIEIEDDEDGVYLNGNNSEETSKKKRDSPKYSGWLFTFNTNRAFPDKTSPDLEDLANKLLLSVKAVFNSNQLKNYITCVNAERIIRIRVFKGVELGKEDYKLHSHVWVSIAHKTKCKLLIPDIFAEVKKKYLELTGEVLPYAYYKLHRKKFHDLDDIQFNYIRKDKEKEMW